MNLEFISAAENLPFAVSIGLFLMLAGFEIFGALIGFSISSFFDSIDFDLDLDIDSGGGASGFFEFLSWVRFGEVPFLVLLFIFLTCFGISGFVLQGASLNVLGTLSSPYTVSLLAFIVTLPMLRLSAGVIAEILPKEESSAIAEESFVGRDVSITLGTAQKGSSAQAKFQDEHGQTHYLMVEPEDEDVSFNEGEVVQIVEKCGAFFKAKASDNAQKNTKDSVKEEVLLETI